MTKFLRISIIPTLIIWIFLLSAIVVPVNIFIFPKLKIDLITPYIQNLIATLILSIGIFIFIAAIISLLYSSNNKRLNTKGIYGIMRHPIYSAIILFVLPSIALYLNLLLYFLVPILVYFIFRIIVEKEEKVLFKIHGNDFTVYRKKVNAFFPGFFRKK